MISNNNIKENFLNIHLKKKPHVRFQANICVYTQIPHSINRIVLLSTLYISVYINNQYVYTQSFSL